MDDAVNFMFQYILDAAMIAPTYSYTCMQLGIICQTVSMKSSAIISYQNTSECAEEHVKKYIG